MPKKHFDITLGFKLSTSSLLIQNLKTQKGEEKEKKKKRERERQRKAAKEKEKP